MHQYTQLVADIRSCCLENKQNRILEENSEGFENSYHSRFCSTTSRKISLTCQTLPCSLSSMISIQKDESEQSMLEPKRINGGRLRSPAPSPVSSPIASPILSPSRSRFVVSRVPETLRSTDSSISSSSIVFSSLGSSPTCVTSASGSSRFRVSVVESANIVCLSKPTIITTEADITVDLNSKVNIAESIDSDDSDNVFELGMNNNNQTIENLQSTSNDFSHLALNVVEETCTSIVPGCPNIKESNTSKSFFNTTIKTQSNDNISSVTLKCKEDGNVSDNQIILNQLEDILMTKNIENIENYYKKDAKDIKITSKDRNDKNSSYTTIITNKDYGTTNTCINENIELQSQTNHDPIQKSTSNLGKLLSLFQHSSCFFSDSTNINQLKNKSTFQGSINSMMTLGDKFHYYIKDKKDRIYNRETEESSVSLKNKSKFFNVSQLPSLQSLANMIPSFKFEGNTPGQSNKYCSKEVNLLLKKDCETDSTGTEKNCNNENLNIYLKRQKSISTLDNQLLSENIQSKFPFGVTNKDIVLTANYIVSNIIDICSKIVNNNLLMHVSNSNSIVPVPKLIGIPEYSVLKAVTNDIQKKNIAEVLDKIDPIEKTNNEILTNSINFTSDNNSLSCSIMYDISNDMHTVDTSDRMHNLVINLSTKNNIENNSVFNVNSTENNTACLVCNQKCVCNVSNKSIECYNTLKINVETNCLNNEVTRMYSIDSNNDKNVFINVHNISTSNELERINVCYVNNNINWKNAVVNNIPEAKISKINFMYKDINFESSNDNTNLCTSVIYRDVSTPIKRKVIKPFVIENNKYFKITNIYQTKTNNVKNTMNNMFKNMNIVMSIPRMYSYMTNFNMLILRNFIHYVADTSIDKTLIKNLLLDLTTNNWPNNIIKVKTLFCDLSQISQLSMNAITEKSDNEILKIKKNILPKNYLKKKVNFYKKQKLKKNEAFEIVSEYSSVPVIADSIVSSKGNVSYLRGNVDISSNLSENIHMLSNFGSNIAQHLKCTNSDEISDTTHQYLNAIKCAAITTTMCSTPAVNTRGNTTVDIISDQNTNIAETSSIIHATR